MTVLTSGLETFDYGTQGWSAIEKANLEKIDVDLRGPFLADNELGSLQVSDEIATQADPAALTVQILTDSTGGTPGTTLAAVIGTFDDTNINNGLASLAAQINKIQADLTELRTIQIAVIDYCDTIKAKINALLVKLRKTGGCGVLDD